MKEKLLIAGGGIFLILFVALIIIASLVGASVLPDGGPTQHKVYVEGTIEVDAFGVGKPDLDPPPRYELEKCGLFSRPLAFFLPDSLHDEGSVRLMIGGEFVASKEYRSAGSNVPFELTSGCFPDEGAVEVSTVLFEGNEEVARDTQVVS